MTKETQDPAKPGSGGVDTPAGQEALALLKRLAGQMPGATEAAATPPPVTANPPAAAPSLPETPAAPPVVAAAPSVTPPKAMEASRPVVEVPPPPAKPAPAAPAAKSGKGKHQASEVPPPPPPGRSKTARNPVVVFLNGIFTFFLLIALVAVMGVYVGKQQFDTPGPLTEAKVVMVPVGSGLSTVAATLERQGAITSEMVFSMGVQVAQLDQKLKAGEYEIKPGMSMRDIMAMMVEGKSITYSVSFPEGWTSEQIVERLKANDILTGPVNSIPLEGTLLPDTYKFTRGTTREQILDRMRKEQEKLLNQIWARRVKDLPLATPRELVILASIVEKETGKADERTRVAGVFVNRLNKKMKLQSDPTILYGLHGGKAWMQARTILRSELTAPNPYNTYQIERLPPGPIGNPGRAAMEAVANPSRTNELFFVADGTGGHAFAETYDEHKKNVERWRQIERSRNNNAVDDAPVQTDAQPAAAPAAAPARQQQQPATRPRPSG